MVKRIIALFAVFAILFSSFPFSAFASGPSMGNANFWEWITGVDNGHPWYQYGQKVLDWFSRVKKGDEFPCPDGPGGVHQWEFVNIGAQLSGKVYCTWCHKEYADVNMQSVEQEYLHDNNLDNGVSVAPSGNSGHWREDCPYLYRGYDGVIGRLTDTLHNVVYPISFSSVDPFVVFPVYLPNYPGGINMFIVLTDSSSVSSPGMTGSSSFSLSGVSFQCFWASLNSTCGTIVGTSDYIGSLISNSDVVSELGSSELTNDLLRQWYIFPSDDISPSVPSTITINNNTYPVVDIDFSSRTVHVTDDRTIIYDDDHITIKDGDTVIQTINYPIENDDPGTDPGSGDDSSTPTDPGTVDPGDASGSGGSGCCKQCALLLRQVNSYLLQIQTLVDQINDRLGPESDNYMEGIYNLLVEINTALDNLPTEPHKDYEAKLTTISNQLANIWGDLDTIKTSLSAVQTNTATTNQKLDTVHADLQAVLAELQTQRGILNQILSVLRDILSHVITIDKNVEELSTEEQQQDFIHSFIGKFSFINQIYQITVQMMRDVTNDAISAQAVSDGIIPSSVLSAGHAIPEDGDDSSGDASIDNRALAGPFRSGPSNPTAPEVMTQFPDVEVLGFNLSQYSALDMSWYAPYKSEVDVILSGFMYLGYLWLLFKRLPSIIRGGAMASSDYDKVQTEFYGKKGD